ncbi:Carboxypeptidase C (cathepsin A) [Phyllobacterium sp. CL33Tsu]|uniref:S10 family serine carboxypeptidase-like protein n=1 Tax=Phyllobacterium sp. CL33Tsu TaxID=1798191 RepID=UPI0008E2A5D0|nr:hypothetical protein [Phyllobacterium sp. CL33Tsu]SFI66988.1 Carboxypeptidase C (cathepsin A) [Phyllobacterium sp. CL33Tsu]
MNFRLCWLLLAVFLASCDGGSDSDSADATPTFNQPAPVKPQQAPTSTVPPSPPASIPVKPITVANYDPDGRVDDSGAREVSASKPHTIAFKGTSIPFTATAGQLIASKPGSGLFNAEAVISYTAYTRDDQPRDARPITFVFNGGPGGSSADLDIGFLGPMQEDGPAPSEDVIGPLKDNPNTILDRTDLVFIDPVGTGNSLAIWPNKNRDFWGADSDAKVLRDFITRYVNVYNRQNSPKYIYGVSYGGFRAPIMARLLLESGTSQYTTFTTSKNVLSGLVLNSPILDITSNCYLFYATCGGAIPTYAMVADFHKKSTARGNQGLELFATNASAFGSEFSVLYYEVFSGTDAKVPDRKPWEDYIKKPEGIEFLNKLYAYTGLGKVYQPGDSSQNNPWIATPNMDPVVFAQKFAPEKGQLLLGDGRYILKPQAVEPAFDRTNDYYAWRKDYHAKFIGYEPQSPYVGFNGKIIDMWDYKPDPKTIADNQQRESNSIPDLTYSMTLNPNLKVLVQHGYYDLNTPFYRSEFDLYNVGLAEKVPVKVYEGGHGVSPYDTGAYDKLMQDLDAFYDGPSATMFAASNPPAFEQVKQ